MLSTLRFCRVGLCSLTFLAISIPNAVESAPTLAASTDLFRATTPITDSRNVRYTQDTYRILKSARPQMEDAGEHMAHQWNGIFTRPSDGVEAIPKLRELLEVQPWDGPALSKMLDERLKYEGHPLVSQTPRDAAASDGVLLSEQLDRHLKKFGIPIVHP